MQTLVIVEHDNQTIEPVTYSAITAALSVTKTLVLLVVGYQCQTVVKQAQQLAGISLVMVADNQCYQHRLAENVSQLIAKVGSNFKLIIAASSAFAKQVMPVVAAMLDVVQISEVNAIINLDTYERNLYAGNAVEVVRSLDEKKIITIKACVYPMHQGVQQPCDITLVEAIFHATKTRLVERRLNQLSRPKLEQAKIVVAGGRGLGHADNFYLIEQLADCLHAAIGASRAAVDAGYIANAFQVGQTGKIIAPNIYIAVGISGAIQHLAGIKDATIIVAINQDADAPMVKFATYSLIGDLFVLVPELIKQWTLLS